MIIPLKVLALILSAEFLCHEGNIFTSPRDSGTGPWHVDRATTPPLSENARDTRFESVSSSIHTTQLSRVTHTVVKRVLENTRNISAKHFNLRKLGKSQYSESIHLCFGSIQCKNRESDF